MTTYLDDMLVRGSWEGYDGTQVQATQATVKHRFWISGVDLGEIRNQRKVIHFCHEQTVATTFRGRTRVHLRLYCGGLISKPVAVDPDTEGRQFCGPCAGALRRAERVRDLGKAPALVWDGDQA